MPAIFYAIFCAAILLLLASVTINTKNAERFKPVWTYPLTGTDRN